MFTLRRFNNFLSLLVLLMSLYIFFLPLVPQLSWWLRHSAPLVSRPASRDLPAVRKQDIPKTNRVIIPAIDLDEEIHEGTSLSTLEKGVWLRPNASSPDKGGNTVLAGHRFAYVKPQGVFYYLDKLKAGDPVEVFWHAKAYIYRVKLSAVTVPQDSSVESFSSDPILTLYTCTPLWSPKERLVIIATKASQ